METPKYLRFNKYERFFIVSEVGTVHLVILNIYYLESQFHSFVYVFI